MGGVQGGCVRRIEVTVKMQKKKSWGRRRGGGEGSGWGRGFGSPLGGGPVRGVLRSGVRVS